MSKPIPTIQKYMTTMPHSVGSDQTLLTASEMIEEYGIRHLPVLKGGKLQGILTDRDIKLLRSLEGFEADELAVEEAMTEEPFCVGPDANLDEVVLTMAEKKYGSAVVVDNHKVVGIFTTVDACRALGQLLHTRLAH
jgi:acetoin utilization protein AcuB